MAPCLDTARARLRQGASLQEAAVAGGYTLSAELDLALWEALPRGRLKPATPSAPKVDLSPSTRMAARFARAGLTLDEAAEARFFVQSKGYRIDEAIEVVIRSRKAATAQ